MAIINSMILLAEDDRDDVFLMERAMLKAKISLRMHNAKNGEEALNYLQGNGQYADRVAYPIPALILLDIKMPYVNGFEVLEWIKQQAALIHIPVVMLTSSLEEADREKARALGALDFFIKPPTAESLRNMLQRAPTLST
jgi:CheY-like chemotaxis protein